MKRALATLKIGTRIVLGFSLLILLFLLVMITIEVAGIPGTTIKGKFTATRDKNLGDLELASGLLGERLASWFAERRIDVDGLTVSPMLRKSIESRKTRQGPEITDELKAFLNSHPDIDTVTVLDPADASLLAVSGSSEKARSLANIAITPDKLSDFVTPGYRERIQIIRGHDNRSHVRIVRQMLSTDASQRIIALLIAECDLEEALRPLIWSIRNNIVSHDWECIIASTVGTSLSQFRVSKGGIKSLNIPTADISKSAPITLALSGINAPYEGLDQFGNNVLAFHRQIAVDRSTSLGLVLKMESSLAYKQAKEDLIRQVLFWLALFGAGFILCIYLARQIVSPVKALAAVALKIEDGDFTARSAELDQSEIGQLVLVFNSMASNIEHSHIEMEKQVADRTKELQLLSGRQNALLTAIPDIIMEVDANRVYKWANSVGLEFFGDDVIGKEAAYYFAGEQNTYQKTELLFEGTSNVLYVESWQRRKDGEIRLLAWWCKALVDSHGTVVGTLSTARDITEQKQAEEVLWTEKAFLRSLIDSASDLIYFKDVNSVYLGCNKASESFTGLSEQEQIGKSDFDFFEKELAEHIVTHDKQVLKGGVAVHLQESVIAADGNRLFMDTVKAPILGKDGQPIGLVGISRDITRQKREEQLTATRLQLIEYSLSHTLDELLTATLDQIEELTGSLIGFFHLLQEDQRTLTLHAWSTRTARDFCKAEGTGSHYDIEKAGVWVDCIHQRQPVIHNDYASLPHRKGMPPGHAAVIRELAVPIFRSDKIVGILGIGNKDTEYTEEDVQIASRFAGLAWDIAERRQIQDSLTESNELFTTAFNNAPIMITISNIEDGTYLDANQQFLDISGFNREEVIGKTSVELGWISETDRIQLKESIQQQGRIHGQEISLHTKTGQTKLCKYWGEVISVAGQKRLLSIALDITEQHKAEQQLQQAQKMESIGSLAGGVAHDFNNLLTVITGHTYLGLMELDANHPTCDHLAEIKKAAERSADLTRQLLAFARKQTISPKIIDLNEGIDGMLKMLRRLIGENIHLAWLPAPDLWRIKADPSQIDQILANLCVNARDAIKGTGRITIETRNNTLDSNYCERNPEAVPGDYVHLSVSDDGSGMDKETMARVFEPFFTTKGVGEGTGLGLATVYGIVKQNNGFINIYSEPGMGTTFTIHLPRLEEKSQKAPTEAKTAPLPKGQETILLVEDEPGILQITSQLLGMQGYTLLTAGTPGEAVRLAQEHVGEINLLITDVIMPEMNGKTLANKLQSLNPQLKCIYMSGYTADVIAQHGVLDEGVYFIQKPFSLPDLASKVREVLDNKSELT